MVSIHIFQYYSVFVPFFLLVLTLEWNSFGYVVEGADFLSDTKEGDIIVSAKVTQGLEYLVEPKVENKELASL